MRSSAYTLLRFIRTPVSFTLFASMSGCLAAPCVEGPASASSSSPPVATAGPAGASASSSPPLSVPYEWKSVVVMGGGFVTGLVYSRIEPGILYARTDIGGAYRYDAKDRSWLPLTDFLSKADSNYMGIESIAVDPVRANRVYMATGMYTQSWAGNGAFMRSDDRGDNWRVIPSTLKMGGNELGRSDGERLAIDPHHPKILYFGSRRSGLWKSVDEAETW